MLDERGAVAVDHILYAVGFARDLKKFVRFVNMLINDSIYAMNEALTKLASRVREAWVPPKVRKQRVGLSKRGKATRKEDKRRRGAVKKSRGDSRRGNFD